MTCFEGTASALAGWQSLGGNISVVRETVPVSSALPNALQLILPAGAADGVGFANTGYSGTKYLCPKQSPLGLTTILQGSKYQRTPNTKFHFIIDSKPSPILVVI